MSDEQTIDLTDAQFEKLERTRDQLRVAHERLNRAKQDYQKARSHANDVLELVAGYDVKEGSRIELDEDACQLLIRPPSDTENGTPE